MTVLSDQTLGKVLTKWKRVSLGTLDRDEPVTPEVTCLTD